VGTVEGETPIRAGWGLADLLRAPEAHGLAYLAPWGDRAVCRCGTITFAEHRYKAWMSDDGHVLAFTARRQVFRTPDDPVELPEAQEPGEPRKAGRWPSSRREAMVKEALGIEDGSPAPEPMDEPEASDGKAAAE